MSCVKMSERYDSAIPQLLAFLGAKSTQIPMKIIPLSERGRKGREWRERERERERERDRDRDRDRD